MTRKDTRNASVLRGSAPFIAVLTVLIALAALAQTRGAGQGSGKPDVGLVSPSVSATLVAQERPVLPGGGTAPHAPSARLHRRGLGARAIVPENPLYLQAVTYFSGGQGPMSVAVADVNGDGKPDLVVANACPITGCSNSEAVGVLLGNGDGTFLAAVTYGSGGVTAYGLGSVAIADVNGDGKPDIVVTNACGVDSNCTSGSVGVLLGRGDGTFMPAVAYGSGGYFDTSVAVADVNGDGKPDIVVANDCADMSCSGNCVVGVLLGRGDGTFMPAVAYGSGGSFDRSVAVADLNGDGKPDVVGATGGSSVVVLLGNGNGTFQPAVAYDAGGASLSVAVADVNGDGKADLLVGNFGGKVAVLLGNGDGTFQSAASYPSGGSASVSVVATDVNADGKPDVLAANVCSEPVNCSSGSVGVLLGNGNGSFEAAIVYGSGGQQASSIAAADLNGDGRPDVLVTNFSSNRVGVLMNNAGTPPTTITLASSVNPAALKQVVAYTATVTSQSGGTVTGTVTFQDAGSPIATVALAGNQAACSTSYNVVGAHSITATYSGDLNNAGSTSAPLTEYIGSFPVSSLTVLTTSMSPSLIGQPVTFTATVKPRDSRYGAIPDGELVTFYDGPTALGSVALAGGTAAYTTASLSAKTHTIKATYVGDSIFKPSTGFVTQVVNKYTTTTTLTSSPNPSHSGQAVTFTAKVTSTGPVPTGKVKFLDGTLAIGSATLSGGVAKLTKSTLAVGTHPITAEYLSDAFSAKSTSAVVNQVVQ
jgi:hypothetical protein